jgi:hypothetical protein
MPYLHLADHWYEVPADVDPFEGELTYKEPEGEDITPLALALATGLLLWAWNPDTAQYTLIAEEAPVAVLGWVGQATYSQDAIRASSTATDFMASFLGDGTLPPDQWYQLMRQEIKEEYIRQYLLGRGGRAQMAAADWGSIGGQLREQYRYLDRFYEQVKAGELSEAQIRARSAMYVRSGREAFERGKARAIGETDYTEVWWKLNPAAENCPDCIELDAMGWQKIEDDPYEGCFPGSGCTVCLTNCMCSLIYR